MAWLLFIDESGQDRRESPYEVLAGVAIQDKRLWPLIRQLADLQEFCFGYRRFAEFEDEAKAKTLLKRKTFRLAGQHKPINPLERVGLARTVLQDGDGATRLQLAALGKAKLDYVTQALKIARSFDCVAFASIVSRQVERPPRDGFLRKDYAYLFERFHHCLEHRQNGTEMGLVVFDELEKTQSHLLVGQMDGYFQRTQKGRRRSRLIIPEPLFVHSDLTTMIQIADLVAYIVAWGVRLRGMGAPQGTELSPFADLVCVMRYYWPTPTGQHDVWGFTHIRKLLPNEKRQ
ncbi:MULTISPECIES: DUF3800 domain-containing protein [unclassified Roseitalea]|uniref:DUF3800 domain-containing protein n=1 Tax=unclassified Roseitalea TaxID=2639107 RepID=UPI00273EFB72|nr:MULTISPECIES: DUF3800 domain-containing protein [unclassified Roseitalea]